MNASIKYGLSQYLLGAISGVPASSGVAIFQEVAFVLVDKVGRGHNSICKYLLIEYNQEFVPSSVSLYISLHLCREILENEISLLRGHSGDEDRAM